MTKDEIKACIELKQSEMPFAVIERMESLKCDDLTIVTHDEEAVLEERGRVIQVIPAWKWCLKA